MFKLYSVDFNTVDSNIIPISDITMKLQYTSNNLTEVLQKAYNLHDEFWHILDQSNHLIEHGEVKESWQAHLNNKRINAKEKRI